MNNNGEYVAVKITEEERDELQRRYYEQESRANLLIKLGTDEVPKDNEESSFDRFMKEYDRVYPAYIKYKDYLEKKYKPQDGVIYRYWFCDFETAEMRFYA